MFYTIYKITNKINSKIYIGKHKTEIIDDFYMGSGKRIKMAIAKYGLENFEKEILFIFDNEDEMNSKEAELVTEEFVKEDTNYNLCPGGKGGWGYINSSGIVKFKGKRHKPESKKKMGHNGNTNWLGRKHSISSKEKIGRNTRIKLSGKPRTDETKKKISDALTGQIRYNIQFLMEIIEYSKLANLSIRKTCKMFGLNRVTYTRYYKEYADKVFIDTYLASTQK